MRSKFSFEERIILFELTNDLEILIEIFYICLTRRDVVKVREILKYTNENFFKPLEQLTIEALGENANSALLLALQEISGHFCSGKNIPQLLIKLQTAPYWPVLLPSPFLSSLLALFELLMFPQ